MQKWSVGSVYRCRSHTRTTFTRDAAVSLAKTKPYHYPNHSHLCAPCQDETWCASHTNKALIARWVRVSEQRCLPHSCFFACMVEMQNDAHNLKPLRHCDEPTSWSTSSKIINPLFKGRGPKSDTITASMSS